MRQRGMITYNGYVSCKSHLSVTTKGCCDQNDQMVIDAYDARFNKVLENMAICGVNAKCQVYLSYTEYDNFNYLSFAQTSSFDVF
jgi:hypothetical protein